MANPFDQFDTAEAPAANPFDQFDSKPSPHSATDDDFVKLAKSWGAGQESPNEQWANDLGKSAASGVVKGAVGLPGVPGSISEAAGQGLDWLTRKSGVLTPEQQAVYDERRKVKHNLLPTSQDVIGAFERNVSGPLYEPQTKAGRYAQSVGEFAPALIGGPGTVATKLLPRVVGPAVGSEFAAEQAEGTGYEGIASLLGAIAGHGVTRAARPLGNAIDRTRAATTGQAPGASVDMPALEREITGGAPEASPPSAVATPRENLGNVRLLNPDVPHNLAPSGRTSAGAAAADTSPLAGYSPEAVKAARDILAENGLDNPHMLDQTLDEISSHHTLAEVAPGVEQEIGKLTAADKGSARNTIVQTLRQRGNEAPQRETALFDRAIAPAENAAEIRRAVEAGRGEATAPLWRAFTRTEIPPTDALRMLMPRLEAAGALRAANKAMREEGLPVENTFESRVAGEFPGEIETEMERMPTAAAFQYAKEHLDSLIERSLAEPGGAKAARRYTQLKNDLVNAIDNHPDPNVAGLWRDARRAWQEPTELLESRKFGERILTQHVDADELPFLIQGWSPVRVRAAEIGLRTYLERLANANRNAARTSNRLMDAVISPGNEQKIRALLGDERADQLIQGIRHEEMMHGAPQRIFGGSPTAGRMLNNRWVPQEGMLDHLSLEALTHPGKAIGKGMAKIGLNKLAKQREEAATQLRDEVARMFMTQGPERDALARALIGAEELPPSAWPRAAPNVSHGPFPVYYDTARPTQHARGGAIHRASGGRVNPDNIDHSPSEAQKKAGNYAKDHVSIHGLDIAIENAKGKKREGTDRGGKKWSVVMPAHYGYIKRTTGKDGDHVDVYLGPHLKSPRVYVVDQRDADSKKFDEHKVFLGFGNAAQARHTYRKAFSDGRANERLHHLTEMSVGEFKDWLANGDTTKPLKRAAGGRAEGGEIDPDFVLQDEDSAPASSMSDPFEQAAQRTRQSVAKDYDPNSPRRGIGTGIGEYAQKVITNTGDPLIEMAHQVQENPRGFIAGMASPGSIGAGTLMGAIRPMAAREAAAAAERATAGALGGKPISDLDREMLMQGMQRAAERRANELPVPAYSPVSSEAMMSPNVLRERLGFANDRKAEAAFDDDFKRDSAVVKSWKDAFAAHGEEVPEWMRVNPKDALDQAKWFMTADKGMWQEMLPDWFKEMYRGRISRASKSAQMYNPPVQNPRPFEADYPGVTGNGRPLSVDIEGRPLSAPLVAGRKVVGGAEESIRPEDFDALAAHTTGAPARDVPSSGIRGRAARTLLDYATGRPTGIELARSLSHEDRKLVYGHEIGHAIDQLADEIPVKGLDKQLKAVYNDLNNSDLAYARKYNPNVDPTSRKVLQGWTPENNGYKGADIPREYMAEAIRAYMHDPNYLKTVAPAVAARIRAHVNSNPELSRTIQFNSLVPFAAGVGAAGIGLAGGEQRARGGRIPGELPASSKASHEEVGYASVSPRKKQHCRDCTKFIPAEQGGPACLKVAQPILPGAWCRRFVLKH